MSVSLAEKNHIQAFNHINFNLYHYAGNNPVVYSDPDGMKISKLTDKQWNTVQTNLSNLISKLDNIINQIDDCGGNASKLNSKIMDSAKLYLSSQFGDLPLDLSSLSGNLKDLKNHLEKLDRDDFKYDDKRDAFAYTYPVFNDIYLGDDFFEAKDSGFFDTKEGTILHESTHYLWGFATTDLTYDYTEMKKLPDDGFWKYKTHNANNWEYFYETVVE